MRSFMRRAGAAGVESGRMTLPCSGNTGSMPNGSSRRRERRGIPLSAPARAARTSTFQDFEPRDEYAWHPHLPHPFQLPRRGGGPGIRFCPRLPLRAAGMYTTQRRRR